MLLVLLLSVSVALGSPQRSRQQGSRPSNNYPQNAAAEVAVPRVIYPEITTCPEVYGLQTYPNPTFCDQFYKCTNGSLTYETCENGLLFDGRGAAAYNHCNYHWGVECEGRQAELLPINTGQCEFSFGIYSAVPCGTYFNKCEFGTPLPVDCPAGLAYDDRIHGCNWPDQLEFCNAQDVVGFSCPAYLDPKDPAHAFLPFPRFASGDCGSYIVCVEGQPRRVGCGDYNVFNEQTLACEDPEFVPACANFGK